MIQIIRFIVCGGVFLLAASTNFADTIENFDSVKVGTLGEEVNEDLFFSLSCDFGKATVEADGIGGTNALCISEYDDIQLPEFIFLDSTADNVSFEIGGGTSFSTSFRFRNASDFSNSGEDAGSFIAGLDHFGASELVFLSLVLTGENWQYYELLLTNTLGQVSSGLRPVAELGIEPHEINEYSDYFSLNLSLILTELVPNGSPRANARGALVDSFGNTIVSLTLELQTLPFSAIDSGFGPSISTRNELNAISQLCIDDICYAVSAVGSNGDANCDGETNLLDVEPFVQMILNDSYKHQADMNSDGKIDLLDITQFVDSLVAS